MPDLQRLYRRTLSHGWDTRVEKEIMPASKGITTGVRIQLRVSSPSKISIAASIISFPPEPKASSIETQGSKTIFPPSSLISTVLVILSFSLGSAGMTTCPFEETRPSLFIPPKKVRRIKMFYLSVRFTFRSVLRTRHESTQDIETRLHCVVGVHPHTGCGRGRCVYCGGTTP